MESHGSTFMEQPQTDAPASGMAVCAAPGEAYLRRNECKTPVWTPASATFNADLTKQPRHDIDLALSCLVQKHGDDTMLWGKEV